MLLFLLLLLLLLLLQEFQQQGIVHYDPFAFHRSVAVAFKPGKALVQINDVVVRELCEGR